ncbi:monovalent cation:proton antiporter-2 (CPA2) family protein [Cohaesibacter haloalkalitolerans]|uniref:monovalent cation:proton antiporter-2 (CPA2) family protein n=1 Tax=Cohaesibacter haloalkalitolerans TaxID=1162980 RepID=UPI000E65D142|nr:monovalent cation:proton antiporter-2 (CPA2) family protein [Cohaesibacter haloalkalitolerans]
MANPTEPLFFSEAIVFLGAAVVAVPIAKRIGVGAIIGYLIAGMVIGPFGLGAIHSVEKIQPIAELGVVLLLFVLGLELNPNRLWRMKSDIFGLGTSQILLTGFVLAGIMTMIGLDRPVAIIGGFGMALSSTAFAVQILKDRGDFSSAYGQRAFGILLMQDIAIVPLLAMVDILVSDGASQADRTVWEQIGITVVAVLLVIVIGRYLLSHLFAILANTQAREMMLAAALLVALGSAALMHWAGLSMALGAFLAGIMLAESSYRHTLEADIFPFRSLLMGLFFMTVGMTLNLPVTLAYLWQIIVGVVVVMSMKGLILWLLAKLTGSSSSDAVSIAAALPQAGEFTFVLFAAATSAGHESDLFTVMSAVVILSMIMTPFVGKAHVAWQKRKGRQATHEPDVVPEKFDDQAPQVLVVGFGRFGMVVAQMLMSNGLGVVAIDNNARRAVQARRLGLPVYYGDATREDVLRAAGAGEALLIALCVENELVMAKSIELIKHCFPKAKIFCRATDRAHAIQLAMSEVDYHIRETFESGITFGREALDQLGLSTERIVEIEREVRQQDLERILCDAALVAEGKPTLPRIEPVRKPSEKIAVSK